MTGGVCGRGACIAGGHVHGRGGMCGRGCVHGGCDGGCAWQGGMRAWQGGACMMGGGMHGHVTYPIMHLMLPVCCLLTN